MHKASRSNPTTYTTTCSCVYKLPQVGLGLASIQFKKTQQPQHANTTHKNSALIGNPHTASRLSSARARHPRHHTHKHTSVRVGLVCTWYLWARLDFTHKRNTFLKAVDTIGNCQRLTFTASWCISTCIK